MTARPAFMILACIVSLALDAAAARAEPAAADRIMETSGVAPAGCTIEKFRVLSPAMGREIKALVVLPPEYKAHPEKRYPILYTLHGAAAPYDCFSAMLPLLQALKDKPMIVTCMDGDAWSWYIDSPVPLAAGRDPKDTARVKSLFTTFFFDEFIPCIDRHYRVNPRQRMLTGFSMGGFGALHYMLARPGEFVSVSALSGAFFHLNPPDERTEKFLSPMLGPYKEHAERYRALDLFTRIKDQVANGVKMPPIYLACGTEDGLLGSSRAMAGFLKEQGVACKSVESAGKHEWPFWRDASAGVIDFHWRSLQADKEKP
ncbi:MAG: alpha/beta hydrolase [Candidatus Brocadiia bacterium]